MARKRRRRAPPADAKPAPAALSNEAEKERLRNELADRIMSLRCREPRRCGHGACRRAQVCQRWAERARMPSGHR